MNPAQFGLVFLFISFVYGKPIKDPSGYQVTSVPGFKGDLPFKSYAGYFPVNDGEKKLFFWFAESQNNPSTDPVVLWLNGGPGCSSFDGFVYEHGPFYFNSGPMGAQQNLTLNPNSWNMVANMIYLDSPAGVGLSYSTNTDDYNTDDKITAHDSSNFLQYFFSQFPEFNSNDFYIAGESYAGIYVPTLAQQVLLYNKQHPTNQINIKGILVGNGVTDEVFDGNAWVPFIWGHSFIPNEVYTSIVANCGPNYWNASSPECNDLFDNATNMVQDLNIYNVYADCYGLQPERKVYEPMHQLRYRMKQRIRDFVKEKKFGSRAPEFDVPCIDSSRATAWINQDSLRTAIHALPVSQLNWTICSDVLNYTEQYTTVIPIYKQLLQNGYRILVYSGDVDMCVPNTGTEAWTSSLNLPLVSYWRPWIVNNQVAGYVTTYKQLTYATIKGSGHMVPQYKPQQALAFFTRFLNDQPL